MTNEEQKLIEQLIAEVEALKALSAVTLGILAYKSESMQDVLQSAHRGALGRIDTYNVKGPFDVEYLKARAGAVIDDVIGNIEIEGGKK